MEEKCVHRVKGETLIIYLPEELDHHTADKIRECTDELFVCKKIRDVIFDYQNTGFMDSSGIGIIIGRYKKISYLGGKVYAIHADHQIRRILYVSGLTKVMDILEERNI